MNRRQAIHCTALGIGAISLSGRSAIGASAAPKSLLKQNINHSVCRWCFDNIPLDELCEAVKDIGIPSVELTTPDEWPVLHQHGLSCALGTHDQVSLTEGFNQPRLHSALQSTYLRLIDQAAEAGVPTIIVFSGNRYGLGGEAGLENCAKGLDRVVRHAQKREVQVVMELFNSKVDHPDYQCDNTAWGTALVDKIGSPHFKLLYDIYHMQIMEGNIIDTIRKYADYFGHYHTAGVPGRHEINDTQELYYPAIMRAIVATGFEGYVAQEFIPTASDPLAALRESVRICDV